MTEEEIRAYIKSLVAKMYVSFGIWIAIIVMQLFIGICTIYFYGYGIATLLLMGYNIFGCIRYFNTIRAIKTCHTVNGLRTIEEYFEKSIPVCWVFMFVNLVFGGVVGFAGNLYDLILAYNVKKIKPRLFSPEEFFATDQATEYREGTYGEN